MSDESEEQAVFIHSYKSLTICAALLTASVCGATAPASVTPKKHYHASVKSSASSRAKGSHASRHHESAPAEMPSERAKQIQSALIKQGYMAGEPTGVWDAQTIAAMQKLQGDNGWQTKITPDSRALIKLGLGPNPGNDASNLSGSASQVATQTAASASAQ